jgi:hypothetical protein
MCVYDYYIYYYMNGVYTPMTQNDLFIWTYIYIVCPSGSIRPPMTYWNEIGEIRPNIAQVGMPLG